MKNRHSSQHTTVALTLLALLTATVPASAEDQKPATVKHKHIANIKYTDYKARDAASGLPTGKRMHKPFVITRQTGASTPIMAKRGKATGKHSFKPISISKGHDTASPMLATPSKPAGGLNQGGLLDGSSMGGAASGPAATGSPAINRGGAAAGRIN